MTSAVSFLRLRPLRKEDETTAIEAHEVLLPDGFNFLIHFDSSIPWATFLEELDQQRRGINIPQGWVPATFLVAVVGRNLVGRVSIRHELNRHLASVGGHIGYTVLPAFRGRGFATEILRQASVIARAQGVERILVTCDEDNLASAKVIERCGGIFAGFVNQPDGGPRKRRYWID